MSDIINHLSDFNPDDPRERCELGAPGCTMTHDSGWNGELCVSPVGVYESTSITNPEIRRGGSLEVTAQRWIDAKRTAVRVAIGRPGSEPAAELDPATARRLAADLLVAADRAEASA